MRIFCSIFLAIWLIPSLVHAQVTITGVSRTTLCPENNFTVNYTITTSFTITNVFHVELSDVLGNFGGSTTFIGSKTSNASGSITCTLPKIITPGTAYKIRIVATDPAITSNEYPNNLDIQNYPLPVATCDASVCEGGPFLLKIANPLTGTASTVKYQWTNPDGYSIAVGSQITLTNNPLLISGRYYMHAEYYGCESFDTTRYVTVNPRAAQPVLTVDDTICAGDTLHLSALSSTPNATYKWTGPNNFKSSARDTIIANITWAGLGYYKAIATANGCPSLPDSQYVLTKFSPSLNATNNSPFCEGPALYISANDSTPGMVYKWTGPGNFSMTSNDTVINNAKPPLSGDYILEVAFENCVFTDTTTVLIKPYPEKPTASNNSPLCSGDTLRLFTNSPTASVSYKWQGPKTYTSDLQNPVIDSISTDAAGNYIVTTDLNGCTQKDTTEVVIITTPDIPVITTNSPVIEGAVLTLEVSNPQQNVSYLWSGPLNFSDTSVKVSIDPVQKSQEGSYYVSATNERCSIKALTRVQVFVTQDTGTFNLYPNPNDGNFTLRGYAFYDQDVSIVISNSLGQLMYSKNTATQNRLLNENISLPSASSGVYFLRFRIGAKQRNIPFTISN